MLHNVLHDAAALSARHYGGALAFNPSANSPRGEWSTLVQVVLEQGKPIKKARDWSWIAESLLGTARAAAEQTASRLADVLEAAGQSGKKAGLLRALAQWWQRRIGDADALPIFHSHSLAHWQEKLRSIRGVSWELADRILLLVGGFAVYPLDRASMRIALRHGWIDATAEYDDWQSFFGSAVRDSGVDLPLLWRGNLQIGRDFCGRRPDCENCPLKTLLPARGPLPLDDEE